MVAETARTFVVLSVVSGLFCAVAWAGQVAKEEFEVGQRWEYQHEGPRPGSVEPNAIDGERILHVVSVVEERGSKQWIIEERFTNAEHVIGRLYVDEERLLTAIEIENKKGEVAKLRYDPPVPYQLTDLDVGKDRTIDTALRMDSADFALPSKIVTQRLEDETITTEAGEFVGCLHYKTTISSTFDIKIAKIPVTEERERWYHPDVNGLVKEVYRKGPVKLLSWSREGYTATSLLTAFGKEQVRAQIGATRRTDDEGERKQQPNNPRSRAFSRTTAYLVLLGAIGIVAVGSYIFGRTKGLRDS